MKQLVRGAGRHSCSNTLLLNRSPSIDVSVVIDLTKKTTKKVSTTLDNLHRKHFVWNKDNTILLKTCSLQSDSTRRRVESCCSISRLWLYKPTAYKQAGRNVYKPNYRWDGRHLLGTLSNWTPKMLHLHVIWSASLTIWRKPPVVHEMYMLHHLQWLRMALRLPVKNKHYIVDRLTL